MHVTTYFTLQGFRILYFVMLVYFMSLITALKDLYMLNIAIERLLLIVHVID